MSLWSTWSQGGCCCVLKALQSPEVPAPRVCRSLHPSKVSSKSTAFVEGRLKFAAGFWYAGSGAGLALAPRVTAHCIAPKRLETSDFNLLFIIFFQLRHRKKNM